MIILKFCLGLHVFQNVSFRNNLRIILDRSSVDDDGSGNVVEACDCD
jgi:hypothetical protein